MISLRNLGGGPWAKFSAQTLSNWALSRSGKVAILRLKSAFNLRLRGLSSSWREAGTHSDALLGRGVKWIPLSLEKARFPTKPDTSGANGALTLRLTLL